MKASRILFQFFILVLSFSAIACSDLQDVFNQPKTSQHASASLKKSEKAPRRILKTQTAKNESQKKTSLKEAFKNKILGVVYPETEDDKSTSDVVVIDSPTGSPLQIRKPIETDRGTYYFLMPGDTLKTVAKKYHIKPGDLAQINDLQEKQFVVGRRLFIPVRRNLDKYRSVTRVIRSTRIEKSTSGKTPTFRWPVERGVVTSGYGTRGRRNHPAIDIGARSGQSVLASAAGRVLFTKAFAGYGNLIVIKHTDNYFTVYAHNSKVMVSQGDDVKQGQKIGLVGSTGHSTGPHVHFEIRKGTDPVDPISLLPKNLPPYQ